MINFRLVVNNNSMALYKFQVSSLYKISFYLIEGVKKHFENHFCTCLGH